MEKENKQKTKQNNKSKKKSKLGIVIFVLITVLVILMISVFAIIKIMLVSNEKENKVSNKYETIMKFDYVNNYPTTPNKIMDDYCYITTYLYSAEILDSEITSVVEKSRELLHFKTIEGISLEDQVREVMNERELIKNSNSFVTETTHSNVIIDTQFPNYADCQVTQYTTSNNNLNGEYILQMEEYKWKIYSWSLKGTSISNGNK